MLTFLVSNIQVGWAYHVDEVLNQASAILNSDSVRRMILNGTDKWKLIRKIFQLNVSLIILTLAAM